MVRPWYWFGYIAEFN